MKKNSVYSTLKALKFSFNFIISKDGLLLINAQKFDLSVQISNIAVLLWGFFDFESFKSFIQ